MAFKAKKEIIEVIIAILVIVGMVYSATNIFAKATDLLYVQASQKLHFTTHAVESMQARIWTLEERNGSDNCYIWDSAEDREEYKKLREKIKRLRKTEDELIKKTTNEGG